jgi:hypothetical protein
MRPDPNIIKAANAAKEILGNNEKLTIQELRVFLENSFNSTRSLKDQKMMNYNFFSQYIPRIGLRFAVEMMFNTEPKQLYLAVVSVNPPAAIYQKYPTFEKAFLFTDIDFESPWSAQRFNEMLFTLKNIPSSKKTTFIIDIKAVTFLQKGVIHLENYGWT